MSTVDGIKDHLNQILTQVAKTQNIEHFKLNLNTEVSRWDGMTGQFYTGDILNQDTGEVTRVAIKKAPICEFDLTRIFKNEDLFYSVSFPVLNDLQKESRVSKPFDNVPKYFCGEFEPKKEYIAMEDLKQFGYVMFDKKQCLDREHLEMIFTIYGKFHALSYVLRNKNIEKYQNITDQFTDITEISVKAFDDAMAAAVSAAVDALDPNEDENVYDEIHDFGKYAVETFQRAKIYRGEHRCMIHGDCWSSNKYSESGKLLDIKLLDFQLCRDGTPIHDLSYFFYSGASKEDFDNLDNYLQIYYESFSEFAKELGATSDELFSFEVLKNEWKENALFGVFFAIYVWQVKLTPKEDYSDATNSKNDDKGKLPEVEIFKQFEVIEKARSSDVYREKTAAILRHAFEYGVLNKNKIIRN